jgi:glycosyltransferase involved in cell wall biosynthesis
MDLTRSEPIEQIAADAPKLTAIVIVRDEEHCLARCLESVAPIADELVVLDSGSTDKTVAIARSFGARVEVTDWPGYGPQKNRALALARGEWILSIDADERVTLELAAEIQTVVRSPTSELKGYLIPFLATWCGRPVRFGDWAHTRHLRLFRRGSASFSQDLVHERIICPGPHDVLAGLIVHDTVATEAEARKKSWRYAELSAQRLREHGRGGLLPALTHSSWTFVRGYLLKRGFCDGLTGWKVACACTRGSWLRYLLARGHRRSRHGCSRAVAAVLGVFALFLT